ncbi:MAG: hypothetical protein ACR2PG_14555 [Hyphomicrobiaceae bacterium]
MTTQDQVAEAHSVAKAITDSVAAAGKAWKKFLELRETTCTSEEKSALQAIEETHVTLERDLKAGVCVITKLVNHIEHLCEQSTYATVDGALVLASEPDRHYCPRCYLESDRKALLGEIGSTNARRCISCGHHAHRNGAMPLRTRLQQSRNASPHSALASAAGTDGGLGENMR